jgi:beta-xylosidase
MITWPRGGMRTQLVFRADRLTGPWEGRVALQDQGVAQGGLVDTPAGDWNALLFQDHGAVGRTPFLIPVTWEDGWPVLGGGKAPAELKLPAGRGVAPGIVASDEFGRRKGQRALPLVWQWNHNPDQRHWSLRERPGYLRLTTGRVDPDLLAARNTLTQRTFGPTSSGTVALDVSRLQDGDTAGLALLQRRYGFVGVKKVGEQCSVVMVGAGSGTAREVESVPLARKVVYLRAQCDFRDRKDLASFHYSLDGRRWLPIGEPLKMAYTLPHFMGYRFALFNYATKTPGGAADFDYFRIAATLPDQPH